MTEIEQHYERLAVRTGRPCYSITFWRTVDGKWGARAGLGDPVFGTELEATIDAAVTAGIVAQVERHKMTINTLRRE